MSEKLLSKDLHSIAIAEGQQIERLLNTFFREKGIFNPVVSPTDPVVSRIPDDLSQQLKVHGPIMKLELTFQRKVILGTMKYVSPFGHHKYGSGFWIGNADEPEHYRRLTALTDWVEAVFLEIAGTQAGSGPVNERIRFLLNQVNSSVSNVAKYIDRLPARSESLVKETNRERTRLAEQSLLFGHPFHPTPKSSEGFTGADLSQYAPEMGASFALHYFAADPAIVLEDLMAGTEPGLFSADVKEAAKLRLPPELQHYRLLPAHPWQADFLLKLPEVQELAGTKQLLHLGPLGSPVYPTSSVRTVWDFNHCTMYKLPLNVKITNFIRVNPIDQLKRAMDASRAVAQIRPAVPFQEFHIISEQGFRTVFPRTGTQSDGALAESFGVVFRQNPLHPLQTEHTEEAPTVVAALLEEQPNMLFAPLWEAVGLAANERQTAVNIDFVKKWLLRYLEISFIPLLWLFLKYGISLEAHVQNSMVALRKGWPAKFYVRDLEGISIGRETALSRGNYGLDGDSPVLYSDGEAWHRFKYYILVNHLGHLIHTLAYYSGINENALWECVGESLVPFEFPKRDESRMYLDDLLQSRTLPAKANLISCFQNRGERPVYVNIPNPLFQFRNKHRETKEKT